ncbi:MAG TPA: S8 family serine peptidase [Burkholderiaceae bacterium]|nr:S8 family serine peptidase [Burkholderiaceae bacterium]
MRPKRRRRGSSAASCSRTFCDDSTIDPRYNGWWVDFLPCPVRYPRMHMTRAHPPCAHRPWRGPCAIALAALAVAPLAHAQLALPRVTLPALPRLPSTNLPERGLNVAPLQSLRTNTIRELLRDHADVLEPDPSGEPIRRHELLLVSPPRTTLDAALVQGFVLLREQSLPALDLTQIVLLAPPGVGTAEALARLRAIDPAVEADFNHVYTRSGELAPAPDATAAMASASTSRRVGLVDSGIDRRHASLRNAHVQAWGCDGNQMPSPHGTAIASLLVGRDGAFSGAVPGVALYAADIYCGQAAGGAVESLALALAWMAREKVAVINVSLVGPANRVLQRAVTALTERGHLIVAAVGNDGPAAPPLYPASYPGVVGVTGITPSRRVLPEAAQGPQVMFSAPGSELAVARPGGGYVVARGSSFAAPLVAGLLAEALQVPDRLAAAAALARVAETAQDLGAPGRDPVYGVGLVAEHARIAPERVQAAAR